MKRLKSLVVIGAIVFVQSFASFETKTNAQIQNVIDFNITPILQCQPFDMGTPEFFICSVFLPFMVEDFIETEAFIDQVFVGYRTDMPPFFLNQLNGPSIVVFVLDSIDGPGMTLATGGQIAAPYSFVPNPFLSRRGPNIRGWVMPRIGLVTIDIDDVQFLILTDGFVSTVAHEVFHATGFPNLLVDAGLNGPTNFFGQSNFIGDPTGVNGIGFGLREFRSQAESGNPFAQFIPLSQNGDNGGHLSAFEPTFNQPFNALQEVFLPTAAPPGVREMMTLSLRGIFADQGYLIRGINAPGIIDIDLDGEDDVPLIVNPQLPTDPQPFGN